MRTGRGKGPSVTFDSVICPLTQLVAAFRKNRTVKAVKEIKPAMSQSCRFGTTLAWPNQVENGNSEPYCAFCVGRRQGWQPGPRRDIGNMPRAQRL